MFSSGGGVGAWSSGSGVMPTSPSTSVVVVVADCRDVREGAGEGDSVAIGTAAGGAESIAGVGSAVAVALGLAKKHRRVAVVGCGSGARLFWQWLKQAHEVQRLLATRQGQACRASCRPCQGTGRRS